MTTSAKTIQIFLPGGDPRGIRVAEITTRIVQVIEVPRSLLQEFLSMPESKQVALYFLLSGFADDEDKTVYIGQTGDLTARLNDHNKKKEWERVLVLISRTNSLTGTHALFLEWYCIQASRKADRYSVENGNDGSKPHTPPPLQADCMEIFDTGRTLLATLGYPVFDPVAKPQQDSDSEVFYCKASGANGQGIYTQEGFVVFKGSTGRRENAPSVIGTPQEKFRSKLIDAGILCAQGDLVVLPKDHLFRSPSAAAFALMGRNCNGWVEWKNKNGQTLDAVKRQTE